MTFFNHSFSILGHFHIIFYHSLAVNFSTHVHVISRHLRETKSYYVIIISHSDERERNRQESQIHLHSSEKETPDEKKIIREKKAAPASDLSDGLKLSYRAESFIFARNRTHPELTF